MGINNLNNLHLTEQQVTALQQAIANLETALKPININLSLQKTARNTAE